jgi:hypothetical protein
MTFENTHIDHIKPVSVFDLTNEEEFKNLQQLLALDNIKKINGMKQKIYNQKYLFKLSS